MNRIYFVLTTFIITNSAYSELSFNPENHFEFGGGISYSMTAVRHGQPSESSFHFIPAIHYYISNWFYMGPSIFFNSYRYNYSDIYSQYDYWIDNSEGIGLKAGFMLNLGLFVYPCLEIGATCDFYQSTIVRQGPPEQKITNDYFRGISFPVSFIGKIPLTSSLLLNADVTVFQGLTIDDNVDIVFSFGLSGVLKNEIVSIINQGQ